MPSLRACWACVPNPAKALKGGLQALDPRAVNLAVYEETVLRLEQGGAAAADEQRQQIEQLRAQLADRAALDEVVRDEVLRFMDEQLPSALNPNGAGSAVPVRGYFGDRKAHADTGHGLSHLGMVYFTRGYHAEAVPLLARARQVLESTLEAPDGAAAHPATVDCAKRLQHACRTLARDADARADAVQGQLDAHRQSTQPRRPKKRREWEQREAQLAAEVAQARATADDWNRQRKEAGGGASGERGQERGERPDTTADTTADPPPDPPGVAAP